MWLVYVGLTVLFSVFISLGFRVFSVNSPNPRIFSVLYNLCAAFWGILIVIFTDGLSFPGSVPTYVIAILIGNLILWGLYERFHFFVRKHLEASVMNILSRVTPIITFLVSIIVLGESITIPKIIGTLLILSGNFVLVWKNVKLRKDTFWIGAGVLVYALMGLCWGIDNIISPYFPSGLYTVIIWAVPVIIIAYPRVTVSEIKKETSKLNWIMPGIALLNALAYYFLIKAFSIAEGSKVIMVYSTETVFTVLAAMIILKERDNKVRKFIAAVLVCCGIPFLK